MSQVVHSPARLPRAGQYFQPLAWLRFLASCVPSLIVFAMLAAVFYWGHHTGWKMPKLTTLMGAAPAKTAEALWCAEHSVPEANCVECQADLMPKPQGKGFCWTHGVAECVICNPVLAQVKGEPQLPKYDSAAAISLIDRPENNSLSTLHQSRVQFASKESAEKAGVDVDVVAEQPMTEAITANGEVTFDPRRVAHLSSRVPGTIFEVYFALGDRVEAGQILALIDASAVGQAKSQLLQAIVQLQLKRTHLEKMQAAAAGLAGRSLLEAEAAVNEADIGFISARQVLVNLGFNLPEGLESRDPKKLSDELRFLGLPDEVSQELSTRTLTTNLLPLRATYSGMIVSTDAVAGEVVEPTQELFTVADPDRLWLTLQVRQEDARYVKVGQAVKFRTEDGVAESAGQIDWISPTIDDRTRTLAVRVHLPPSSGQLRDNTFGTGRIILREEPNAVVVPREALQASSDATFVFVRDRDYLKEGSPKVFHVRQVRVGAKDGKHVELLAGVLPGEVVATKGSSVLMAQLLRSTLGAGCGHHH